MKHKKITYRSDFMSRKQDEQLEQLEERLTALYANAANEIKSNLTDFMDAYKKQDEKNRAAVASGAMPEDEYTAWRRSQMINNTRYTAAVENMTNTLVNTDVAAMAMTNGELPRVLAESFDFTTALGSAAAKKAGMEAATFQIYNQETVQALVKDKPNLFPKPSQKTIKELGGTVDIPEDKKWNKDRITRELTQGIIQGEDINKIADRLQRVTTMDQNAAIRNARTAYTSAENLGRTAAAEDIKAQGVPIDEVWSATYDNRTRDTHLLLDGTKRDESGYFGVGLLNIPLRYPADPDGEPEEVYNCRCRLNIELAGIDHSNDEDLYDQFMQENYPDDYDALKENEGQQAREAEADAAKDRQAELRAEADDRQAAATSGNEDLPKASELDDTTGLTSGDREVVQGGDITETFERRPDQYPYEIDDVLAAQGFNGLPEIATPEEFDKAVAESGFIAQRTYAAPDQETLDAYRDQLYNGDWYVNCETGGAQYGQGMYCAADYNGELTDGIKEEMAHYQELGKERYGDALSYTETLTLTPDAKIISYEDINKEFRAYRDEHSYEKTISEARNQIFKEMGVTSIRDKADYMTMWNLHTNSTTESGMKKLRELEAKTGTSASDLYNRIHSKYNDLTKNNIHDVGSFAASRGYDAINAGGHGKSGSYTVILNRTKVIFKGEKKK